MQEIWKDVIGYEGIYQVSNLGRAKSLSRIINKQNSTFITKEKILSQSFNKKKYLIITLRKNNISKTGITHRLIANAFIPNPKNKPQVNHIDGDKSNNTLDNLEWCTNKENIHHAIRIGLIKFGYGANSRQHKTVYQYGLDNVFIKKYISQIEASNTTGIINTSISNCCLGLSKTAGGYKWSFNEYKK